jgi:ethanolamine ammonia-lyase large subunit
MWTFFQELCAIDVVGKPTEHFGQPAWVYLQFQRRKGDDRPDGVILNEAQRTIAQVRGRGVAIAEGHGANPWDLDPHLDNPVRELYADSKQCILDTSR